MGRRRMHSYALACINIHLATRVLVVAQCAIVRSARCGVQPLTRLVAFVRSGHAQMSYWDKKPGYVKQETRALFERFTARQFMGRYCTHKENHWGVACNGWNRKGWDCHDKWLRDQRGAHNGK